MDPVTAFGLACNVLQVVEVGIKLTKEMKQIHDRGSLSENDELKQRADEISTESKILQAELHSTGQKLGRADIRVRDLAQEAIKVGDDLKRILNRIVFAKGQAGKKETALKQIVRTHLKKSQIEQLSTRLQVCEAALDRTVLRELYVRAGETQILHKTSFAALRLGQQAIIQAIVDTDAQSFVKTIQAIHKSKEIVLAQIVDTGNALNAQTVNSERNLRDKMQQMHFDNVRQQRRQRLLDSLSFPSISQRQHIIQQRVGGRSDAFRWIFEPQQPHGFPEWLRSGDVLYWISGKPGSGKSSLVEFIQQELKPGGAARASLEAWSDPKPLAVLSFFYYSPPADPLQKSLEGLFRSLCYQLLTTNDSLCDAALDDDRAPAAFRQLVATNHEYGEHWMTRDLDDFFTYLVKHSDRSIFVLLDGLDEFGVSDRSETHLDLVRVIRRISGEVGLKVCCSSRPDAPFNVEFSHLPGLKVQDLTRSDIASFVHKKLGGTRASGLAWRVVEGAEGVFLWAHIVVEAVLQAITEGDSLDDLQNLIQMTHGDMTELFKAMLQRANASHQASPKPFLQYIMVNHSFGQVTHLSELLFTTSDQDELDICFKDGFSESFIAKLIDAAIRIEQQVIARCAGLVHAVYHPPEGDDRRPDLCNTSYCGPRTPTLDHSVLESLAFRQMGFIHRSASDFIRDDPAGHDFLEACSIANDRAHLILLRANVARMALGVDHPFLGRSYVPYITMVLYGIVSRQQKIEGHAPSSISHHLLTDRFLAYMILNFGYIPETACDTKVILSQGLLNRIWLASLPLGVAWRLTYASSYGLFSYMRYYARQLNLEEKRVASTIALMSAAMQATAGNCLEYLRLVSDLQALRGLDPVTHDTDAANFVLSTEYYDFELAAGPLWQHILSFLVYSHLKVAHAATTSVQAVLDALHAFQSPSTEPIELAVTYRFPDVRAVTIASSKHLPRPDESSHPRLDRSIHQLTLHCTIESLICLLLPGTGYPEWGSSGIGELPYPVRWKPRDIDRWLNIRDGQGVGIWSFVDERYILNQGAEVEISESQLAELSRDELVSLRSCHKELGPGRFKLIDTY